MTTRPMPRNSSAAFTRRSSFVMSDREKAPL